MAMSERTLPILYSLLWYGCLHMLACLVYPVTWRETYIFCSERSSRSAHHLFPPLLQARAMARLRQVCSCLLATPGGS